MATYPTPTVDVDIQTMSDILAHRPDIQQLYRANVRADGRPWYPNDVPDVPAIITDWWTRVAGGNDTPSLYQNSLAEWAKIFLDQDVVPVTPGSKRSLQSATGVTRGNIMITGGVLLMATLLFIGGRRTAKPTLGTYVPTGGFAPEPASRSRKK